MKYSRKNIGATEVFTIHLLGVRVEAKSKFLAMKVILIGLMLLIFVFAICMVVIKSLFSEERILSKNIIKGVGGFVLGLVLINLMKILFDLSQDYLNKLKEKRKRRVIEEKYDIIKEKIENQKSYLKDRFKDSDQLDLLKKHLKKLEEEELNNEIEKIEELKAKFYA